MRTAGTTFAGALVAMPRARDERDGSMNDQPMQVEFLDPDDDEAVARWAAQLGVPVATLREAAAAIGTDIDKIKVWLVAHQSTP
jgi:hypothetical protein